MGAPAPGLPDMVLPGTLNNKMQGKGGAGQARQGSARLQRNASRNRAPGYTSDSQPVQGTQGKPRMQRTPSSSVYVSGAPFASVVDKPGVPDTTRQQTVFRVDSVNGPPGAKTLGRSQSGAKGRAPSRERARSPMPGAPADVFSSGAPFSDGARAVTPSQPRQTVFRVESMNLASKGRNSPAGRSGVVYPGPASARASPMHPAAAVGSFKAGSARASPMHPAAVGSKGQGSNRASPVHATFARPQTSHGSLQGAGRLGQPARPGTGHGAPRGVPAKAGSVPLKRIVTTSMNSSKSWNDVSAPAKSEKKLGPSMGFSRSHASLEIPATAADSRKDEPVDEDFGDCIAMIDSVVTAGAPWETTKPAPVAHSASPPAKGQHNPVVPKASPRCADNEERVVGKSVSLKKANRTMSVSSAFDEGKQGGALKRVPSFPWLGKSAASSLKTPKSQEKEGNGAETESDCEGKGEGDVERPPSRGFNFRVFGSWHKPKVANK